MINKTSEPYLITGGIFQDKRGILKFVNELDLSPIKRFYIIYSGKNSVRAWQGHKKEFKYFYAIKGKFTIFTVKIDNWGNPDKKLKPKEFSLDEESSKVLIIPPGFANGILTLDDDSYLLIFSNLSINEAKEDLYRFNEEFWVNWGEIIK